LPRLATAKQPTAIARWRLHLGALVSGVDYVQAVRRRRELRAELRAAMLSAVTPEDLTAIVATLVKQAKAGDTAAARVALNPFYDPEGARLRS
jgi:hypothetical protein